MNLGYELASREYHGSNVALLLHMRLNRPEVSQTCLPASSADTLTYLKTYIDMSRLDREMHLRVWWIAYCGDRSAACGEGGTCLISEGVCQDLSLPSDLYA